VSISSAVKEPFRARSAKNVFEEIDRAYNLGIRHFNFEDDNISMNPNFESLLDLIIENLVNRGARIKVSFMNGVRSNNLNRDILDKLIRCGLTHLDLSLVSKKTSLKENLRRRESSRDIFSISNYLAKRGIPSSVHFIVGLPTQRFGDCLRDVLYLSAKRVFLGPSIFYPVIESDLFRELKKLYQIKEEDYSYFRSSCAYFEEGFARDGIFSIVYLSRIINFIKEVIDRFNLDQDSFMSWIEACFGKLEILDNKIISPQKVDEYSLGAVILRKLLSEFALFRVILRRDKNNYVYKLIREDFFPSGVLEPLLKKGILIRGVIGAHQIRLQGACFAPCIP
jgi:hypothetical protein